MIILFLRCQQIARPNGKTKATFEYGHSLRKTHCKHGNCQWFSLSTDNVKMKTRIKREQKKSINETNLFTDLISMVRARFYSMYILSVPFCVRSVVVLCAPFIVPLKNVTYACNHNQFVINMVIFNK